MKRVYENLNDLLEAAERFGYFTNQVSDNRITISGPWTKGSYTRGENGGWYQDTTGTL